MNQGKRTIGDRLYDYVDRAKVGNDADAMQNLSSFLGEHSLEEFIGDNKSPFATAAEILNKADADDIDIFLQTVEAGEPYTVYNEEQADMGPGMGDLGMEGFTDDEDQDLDLLEAQQGAEGQDEQSLADLEAEQGGEAPLPAPEPQVAPFPGKAPSDPNLEQ